MPEKNNKIKYLRGSEWRKWDLHIHSDAGSPEQIVNRLIEKEISVFSITDHCSVDRIDDFWEMVDRKQRQNQEIHFLPGIELRTDKGKKSVHLIGIFPLQDKDGNQINSNYLKQNLLSKIGCSDTDIIIAGKKVLREGKTKEEYIKKGYLEKTVNFEKAAKQIKLLGGITIVHAGTKSSGIETEMSHAKSKENFELLNSLGHTKRDLMEKYILVCELPNWNDSNLNEKNFYLKQFEKPSIVCSDSHKLSTIGTRYTWIKADPVFEGLRQIIYEPEERIYVGEGDPRKFTYNVFESLRLKDDVAKKFFIRKNKNIFLNPGLNVLIGSRGSGKSVLLDSIALASNRQKVNPVSYVSSFLKKHKKSSLSCYINTQGGAEGQIVSYSWSGEKQTECFPFEYFPQKKIGKLAEARTLEEKEELSAFIHKHIFMEVAKDSLEKIDNIRRETLSSLEHNGRNVKDQENIIITEEKIGTQLNNLKKQLKSYDRKELREMYKKRSQTMALQEIFSQNISNLERKIKEYKNLLRQFNPSELIKIKTILDSGNNFVSKELKEDFKREIDGIIPELKSSFNAPTLLLDKIKTVVQSYEGKLNLSETLRNIEKEIQEKSKQLGIKLSEQLNETVRKIQGKITELDVKKETIIEAKEKKIELIKQRKELLDIYIEELNNTEKLLKKAFDLFCEQDGKVLKGSIKIDFYRDISNEDYIMIIEKNKTMTDEDSSRKFPGPQLHRIFEEKEDIQDIIRAFRERNFKPWEKIKEVASRTVNYLEAIENTEEIAMLLEETLPSLKATIKWKDKRGDYKPLPECSVGERSTAVLSIILASGRSPLVIDQPEEDLDNFYIFKRLVPIIKTVKKRRQLIFATHDANIVVNADAELILILESPDGKHAEINLATIENTEKRNDIINILEGGVDAFAKREKKLKTLE